TLSGSLTWKRVARSGAFSLGHSEYAVAPNARANTAATTGHSHDFALGLSGADVGGTEIGTLALAELMGGASRSIISSVGFKSRAVCQRSSGFFSRHFLTTRSNWRGTAGWRWLMGGGWSF